VGAPYLLMGRYAGGKVFVPLWTQLSAIEHFEVPAS